MLLDRAVKPIYTAILETPKETETQYIYDLVPYTWPSMLGGYNPDLSGPYFSYVEGLMHLAEFYDEFFSDNMWRSLTHEAIKTLDWTYVSNSDGDIQDMSTIDTSRIEPITKIYGRQFDDLKRYADAIKSINTITYNQKSNTPDYTLTDVLENSGWETKTLKITSDNDLATESLYSGLTSGYTSSDANNEFLRRLKLNSNYLFSVKGTRKGLDAMLAMFGFTPDEYEIHEYVYVFSGNTFPHFCNDTEGNDTVAYPLAKDVSTINHYKVNFNALDPYTDYCGIPVAEVGYSVNGKDCSYVVPWFSYGKNYDDGLYFQMHGGWGKRNEMDIDLEIASAISSITAYEGVAPLYMETQARLKFAKDFDELLQQAFSEANLYDVFYVTDVSKIATEYTSASTEDMSDTGISHYFILEDVELNQFLGYSQANHKYGWRSIAMSEILQPNTAGTLVLYLESIKDDTSGNNPHIGNGTYDDGMAYISGMSEIFAYSLLNRNFIGIDDDTCERIKDFKFGFEKQEDNRKCWFFTDNHNSGYGKDVKCVTQPGDDDCCTPAADAEKIYFREVDITDKSCDLHNCNDSIKNKGKDGCDESLNYDIAVLLASANENQTVNIGKNANSTGYFISGDVNTISDYNRGSSAWTFDPETRQKGTNGEAAANSIVNVKNLDIVFTLPNCNTDEKRRFKQYIETAVVPYLTQMIPSTSIMSLGYKDDARPKPPTPTPVPPDPEECTTTYELMLNPNVTSVEIAATGETSFTLTYVTKKTCNGQTTTTTKDVTNLARWTSSDTTKATVSNGHVVGRNDDTQNDHTVVITASYPAGQASPKSVNVKVKRAGLPSISLAVTPPIDATATTLSYTATCTANVVVKYDTQTKTTKQGTFIVPANTTSSVINHVITASCADYPSQQATATVKQNAGQQTDPTISLTVNPSMIDATGATVSYRVTVNPSTTNVKVKCGNTTKTSKVNTFSFTANTGTDPITHFVSAWCADREDIIDVQEVIQQGSVFVPSLTLTAVYPQILATATAIVYNVKSNTGVDVKYGNETKHHAASQGTTDGFDIPQNEGEDPIVHIISAICTDYPDVWTSVTITQAGAQDPTANFSVSPANLVFAPEGETKTVTISNVPDGYNWKVTDVSASFWVTLPETAGTTDKMIDVVAGRNETGAKSGRLKVELLKNSTVKSTKYVELDQDAEEQDLFAVSDIPETFPYAGGSQYIIITNPQEHHWTASTIPSWITLDTTYGEDGGSVGVNAATRTDGGAAVREEEIVITDLTTNKEHRITAKQNGSALLEPEIRWTHWAYLSYDPYLGEVRNIPFGADGGSFTFNIYASDDLDQRWKISFYDAEERVVVEKPDWVTISKQQGTGNDTVTVTVTPSAQARICRFGLAKYAGESESYIIYFKIIQN